MFLLICYFTRIISSIGLTTVFMYYTFSLLTKPWLFCEKQVRFTEMPIFRRLLEVKRPSVDRSEFSWSINTIFYIIHYFCLAHT